MESVGRKVPLLAGRAISKAFGANQVLFDLDIELQAGRVHALVGENGAGKSTLVNILCGYLGTDSGQVEVSGQPQRFASNAAAEALGLVMIHQEFNLAEQLSVEENLFLGREIRKGLFVDRKAMQALTRQALDRLQADIRPDSEVASLSTSEKQMVEIAKAVSRNAKVIVMDEPTAVLTEAETPVLFALIRQLTREGVAVLYISHKLNEIEEIADDITILRDGRLVHQGPAAALSKADMASLMVGRELAEIFPPQQPPAADAETVLEMRGIEVDGAVKSASFSLRRGEILGLAGVVGSGRTALMESLAGLRPMRAGEVTLFGKPVQIRTCGQAVAYGISYLTDDRKGKGLLLDKGLEANLNLMNLKAFGKRFINQKQADAALQEAVETFDIRLRTDARKASDLSGGNQQKLLLGKIMSVGPDIVIINEPTRGVDIGTKQQLYRFIAERAKGGTSFIVISSEMPELIGLSHRIAVMFDGTLTGTLEGDRISEAEIMHYISGIKEDREI